MLKGHSRASQSDLHGSAIVKEQYRPSWNLLNEKTREKVLKGTYERIFDGARHKVRAWEIAQGFLSPGNPR
jgi:hypothetical protein